MKTTYSYPLLCAFDYNDKILNFCFLNVENFLENNTLIVKIANTLNLSNSHIHYHSNNVGITSFKSIKLTELYSFTPDKEEFELNLIKMLPTSGKYLIDNNIEREGKYIEMVKEYYGIDTDLTSIALDADIVVEYLIEEITTYANPNSYVIIPKNTEIIGIPQIEGSFDRNTNTFIPRENLRIIPTSEWEDCSVQDAKITKSKPDETYIFNFEENEWMPDPELDYNIHGDGKPYRYNPEYKSWYPNWEPEPETDS
jgi:hypothetical protein